jgi:hypothetical protein
MIKLNIGIISLDFFRDFLMSVYTLYPLYPITSWQVQRLILYLIPKMYIFIIMCSSAWLHNINYIYDKSCS